MSTTLMRWLGAGVAAVAATLALTSTPAVAARPASPASGVHIENGWGWVTQGNLRPNPNQNNTPIVTIYNSWVDIVCWIDGGDNGFGSYRWFKANYYAKTGYLSSGVVTSQPSVGHC